MLPLDSIVYAAASSRLWLLVHLLHESENDKPYYDHECLMS